MKTKILSGLAVVMALMLMTTPASAVSTSNYNLDWRNETVITSDQSDYTGATATDNSSNVYHVYEDVSTDTWYLEKYNSAGEQYSVDINSNYANLAADDEDIHDIVYADGYLWIAAGDVDGGTGYIFKVDPSNGNLVDSYSQSGRAYVTVTVTSAGEVFAVDGNNQALRKLDSNLNNVYGANLGTNNQNNPHHYLTSEENSEYVYYLNGNDLTKIDASLDSAGSHEIWDQTASGSTDTSARGIEHYNGSLYTAFSSNGVYELSDTGGSATNIDSSGIRAVDEDEGMLTYLESSNDLTFNNLDGSKNTKSDSRYEDISDRPVVSVSPDGSKVGSAVRNNANSVNGLEAWTEEASVSSVDISISGNTTEYNTTGSDNFEVNATATFSDGSTQEVSEDSSSSYSYDTNILNQLSPKDIFEGNNAGTTDIQISYTDSQGNTVTDNITVNVKDPADVQSISLTGLDSEYDEGDTDSLTATITRTDGSTEVVTTDSETTWSSSNSTRMSVGTDGNVDALYFGDVDISVEYTDSWSGTTVSDTSSTTILGDPSRVEFNVSDDNPRQDVRISMSATLYYEDGRTKDVTDDITATNTTSNKPARTDFEFSNQTVVFTDDANYTLTFATSYEGVPVSDQADVTVRPCICFEDYNKLSGPTQMFLFFSDWGLWAILASILLGGMIGLKMGGGAGIATTTIALAIAWLTGFVSIFVPATLILFEIFIMVVLDVQMVDFN